MKMTCNIPDHAAAVECMLEGFVQLCQLCIAAGLAPPDPTMVPTVKYRLEGPGEEDWKLPQNVIRDGWGDCEDLAGWRAGGLRATGEDPEASVVVVQTGAGKLHAVVRRGSGEIDDVCREMRATEKRWSILGDGGVTVHKRGDGWTPPPPPSGAPPAAGGMQSPGPTFQQVHGGQTHVRLPPGSQAYANYVAAHGGDVSAAHPQSQAYADAAQARIDAGETAANRYGGGSTTTYTSPDDAYAHGIDPDTGARGYTPPFDPGDPSTWPDGYTGFGDPNDPSTWGAYGYGGYGGAYPGGYYGGGYNPWYGYGGGYGWGGGYNYDQDMPYAGGYPWAMPPDDLSPATDWGGLDEEWGG